MSSPEKQIAMSSQPMGVEPTWENEGDQGNGLVNKLLSDSEFRNVIATFLTTLAVFGIFLGQGIYVARILGALGRGEFGTALFFPREVFLYAGLLGGIEIVNSYAMLGTMNVRSLKYSAAKVGLISGVMTSVAAALVAITVLICVGKTYLIPFCLLCCLFVPWEHMQLTISAVDRGTKNFFFYNVNRLIYAASFVVLLAIVFESGLYLVTGLSPLTTVCILFVLSRIVGLAPTLRGMDVYSTLTGTYKEREVEGQLDSSLQARVNESNNPCQAPLDQASEDSKSEEQVSVPTPWTLLKQGRFYALSVLASEVFERLDVFLIVAIATVQESGYYFVAVPAAQMLIVAPNALGVFTFNAGADKTRTVSVKKALGVMGSIAGVQILSALFFALILPFLITRLYGATFAPAIPFALWLLPACALKGYLQAVDGYLKGRDKPMIGVWSRFLSIFVVLAFVALAYAEVIPFEVKLLSIPIGACIGQALATVLISTAAIKDVISQQNAAEPAVEESEVTDVSR